MKVNKWEVSKMAILGGGIVYAGSLDRPWLLALAVVLNAVMFGVAESLSQVTTELSRHARELLNEERPR